MKVVFEHGGKEGMLHYSEGDQQVVVSHPDKKTRDLVHLYLNKERDFAVAGPVPEGCRGNRMRMVARGVDDSGTMDMALSEMKAHIGAHVKWDDPRNRESVSVRKMLDKKDENAKADKPIVKSIDGDTDFYIIN